jgi:hypothetical protein
MTELNRHERATDVASLTTRFAPGGISPPPSMWSALLMVWQAQAPRRVAVLEHLRDRLFDLSRRNRLLYFKPTSANVNLTVASVPLMLQIDSVKPEHICTWGGPFAEQLAAGKPVSLGNWLRFDDQPYLPATLDKLISKPAATAPNSASATCAWCLLSCAGTTSRKIRTNASPAPCSGCR